MRRLLPLSPTSIAFTVVSAFTLIVVGGCSGRTPGADSRPNHEPPATADASTPVVRQWVQDLIAPSDVPFSVAFQAHSQYFVGPENFVWRQGKGAVRWDIVPSGSAEPDIGWISIESDAPLAGDLPYDSIHCLWFRRGSSGAGGTPQADVSCSEGASFPGLLDYVMVNDITERLPDQIVAGRTASCYSFDDPSFSDAVFCVDSSKGIPLLLSIVSRWDPGVTQEIRAVSVSTVEQNVAFPVQMERDPVDGWWDFEGVVPILTLQLPDFSEIEE